MSISSVLERVVFLDEVADFLASSPSREDVLAYHPSPEVEARFRELLDKQRESGLTATEQEELDQFRQTEMLLRLLKARLRLNLGTP